MTRKTVTVRLTLPQALALSAAIGNSINADEDRAALFGDPQTALAALRGAQALDDAIRAVGGFGLKAAGKAEA